MNAYLSRVLIIFVSICFNWKSKDLRKLKEVALYFETKITTSSIQNFNVLIIICDVL